ncbi:MAG TPA: acyl-CoA dehydrogenase family protein [Polyangium sp.]|nr:acyl-CoA dehydrogenase family protein [Polyangium sp.]
MIPRTLFSPDHEAFRDAFRKFCEGEIAPHHEAWEEQGYVDREVWRKAGANGYLCATLPEEFGGATLGEAEARDDFVEDQQDPVLFGQGSHRQCTSKSLAG